MPARPCRVSANIGTAHAFYRHVTRHVTRTVIRTVTWTVTRTLTWTNSGINNPTGPGWHSGEASAGPELFHPPAGPAFRHLPAGTRNL